MALFKFNRGNENNLPANLVDGYCYITSDKKRFYFDFINESGQLQRGSLTVGESDTATKLKKAVKIGSADFDGSAAITLAQMGALASSLKGANNGLAELDSSGKVPASQLPSFVDDVLEFESLSAFPTTGESGKIYISVLEGNSYRWTGTTYAPIGSSIALGETSSTAYRGDRGKIAYDHSQITNGTNPHKTTFANIESKPTTIGGYGITDAKIANGVITIGSSTITPLTPSSSLDASKIGSGTLAAARLATSGVTAGSYGPSGNTSATHGGTITVPQVTVDTYGRVTSAASRTITMPSVGYLSRTVTLAAASWSNKKQTVTVNGVTASNTVIVSAAPASLENYNAHGIICTAQGANSLTFDCEIVPTVALTVYVIIMG